MTETMIAVVLTPSATILLVILASNRASSWRNSANRTSSCMNLASTTGTAPKLAPLISPSIA
jgi:hypothetical protein